MNNLAYIYEVHKSGRISAIKDIYDGIFGPVGCFIGRNENV